MVDKPIFLLNMLSSLPDIKRKEFSILAQRTDKGNLNKNIAWEVVNDTSVIS